MCEKLYQLNIDHFMNEILTFLNIPRLIKRVYCTMASLIRLTFRVYGCVLDISNTPKEKIHVSIGYGHRSHEQFHFTPGK